MPSETSSHPFYTFFVPRVGLGFSAWYGALDTGGFVLKIPEELYNGEDPSYEFDQRALDQLKHLFAVLNYSFDIYQERRPDESISGKAALAAWARHNFSDLKGMRSFFCSSSDSSQALERLKSMKQMLENIVGFLDADTTEENKENHNKKTDLLISQLDSSSFLCVTGVTEAFEKTFLLATTTESCRSRLKANFDALLDLISLDFIKKYDVPVDLETHVKRVLLYLIAECGVIPSFPAAADAYEKSILNPYRKKDCFLSERTLSMLSESLNVFHRKFLPLEIMVDSLFAELEQAMSKTGTGKLESGPAREIAGWAAKEIGFEVEHLLGLDKTQLQNFLQLNFYVYFVRENIIYPQERLAEQLVQWLLSMAEAEFDQEDLDEDDFQEGVKGIYDAFTEILQRFAKPLLDGEKARLNAEALKGEREATGKELTEAEYKKALKDALQDLEKQLRAMFASLHAGCEPAELCMTKVLPARTAVTNPIELKLARVDEASFQNWLASCSSSKTLYYVSAT
jgi:hypothetical protein